jgi:hypothetical protein
MCTDIPLLQKRSIFPVFNSWLLLVSISSYLSIRVSTASSAFSSETCHTLGKLCLFANFIAIGRSYEAPSLCNIFQPPVASSLFGSFLICFKIIPLWCDAVYSGRMLPMLLRNLLPQSSFLLPWRLLTTLCRVVRCHISHDNNFLMKPVIFLFFLPVTSALSLSFFTLLISFFFLLNLLVYCSYF